MAEKFPLLARSNPRLHSIRDMVDKVKEISVFVDESGTFDPDVDASRFNPRVEFMKMSRRANTDSFKPLI